MKFKLVESENEGGLEVWSEDEIYEYLNYKYLLNDYISDFDGSSEVKEDVTTMIKCLGDDIIGDYLDDGSYDGDEEPIRYTCEDYIELLNDIGEIDSKGTFENIFNLGVNKVHWSYRDVYFFIGADMDTIVMLDEDEEVSPETKQEVKRKMAEDRKAAEEKIRAIQRESAPKTNLTRKQVEDAVNSYMRDNYYAMYDYVERGYILRDGELILNKDIIRGHKNVHDRHGDADKIILKDVAKELGVSEDTILATLGITRHDANGRWGSMIGDVLGWIRVNGSGENYIAIPEMKITTEQKYALADWLDNFHANGKPKIGVTTGDGVQTMYYFDGIPSRNIEPYEGIDIVNKIMRYYSSGKLEEDRRMKFELVESIEKQPDVEYKGITIEHFPLNWELNGETWDEDGWVIKSPYYIQSSSDKPKTFMPLYCENEKGEVLNFHKLEDAKKYIDDYIVTKKGKLKIKHGDEVHFELEVSDDDLEEDTKKVADHKWVNKGEDGTHGEFRTKKEADAQRKAMFANGYAG